VIISFHKKLLPFCFEEGENYKFEETLQFEENMKLEGVEKISLGAGGSNVVFLD